MMARLLLVLWIALGAVYLAMLLWSLPHLSALAGGARMFDMRPGGYDHETARRLVAALGEEGRRFYLGPQRALDTVFPGLELIVLVLSYFRLFPRRIAWALVPLALGGTGFDFLENAAVDTMLRAGDALTPEMAAAASRWTLLKSIFVTLALSALLAGLLRLAWRRFAR